MTHIRSILRIFCRNVERGVFSFRKNMQRNMEMPVSGRFKSDMLGSVYVKQTIGLATHRTGHAMRNRVVVRTRHPE